jgi:hypothetical protein
MGKQASPLFVATTGLVLAGVAAAGVVAALMGVGAAAGGVVVALMGVGVAVGDGVVDLTGVGAVGVGGALGVVVVVAGGFDPTVLAGVVADAAGDAELFALLLEPQPLSNVTKHTNLPSVVSALILNSIASCS